MQENVESTWFMKMVTIIIPVQIKRQHSRMNNEAETVSVVISQIIIEVNLHLQIIW